MLPTASLDKLMLERVIECHDAGRFLRCHADDDGLRQSLSCRQSALEDGRRTGPGDRAAGAEVGSADGEQGGGQRVSRGWRDGDDG